MIDNAHMEMVASFTYLGSHISPDGQLDEEISTRIARAALIFAAMKCIWSRRDVRIETKTWIYCATVRATLLYATETWPVKLDQLKRMETFDECRIAKIHWTDFISNEAVRQRCHLTNSLTTTMILPCHENA